MKFIYNFIIILWLSIPFKTILENCFKEIAITLFDLYQSEEYVSLYKALVT